MKSIAAYVVITMAALFGAYQLTAAAVAAGINNNVAPAAHVGLYAPDRYDGIPEMCLMPMDFGYCRAKVKRYYFDMRRMKCAMFYWGGCAGNINNFKSLDECNKVCIDDSYDDVNNNDNTNTRNNVINNSNNNNNKFNYRNNNNSSSSSGSSSNYKNDNRRFGTDGARQQNVDKNDNFEDDDEADYTNN